MGLISSSSAAARRSRRTLSWRRFISQMRQARNCRRTSFSPPTLDDDAWRRAVGEAGRGEAHQAAAPAPQPQHGLQKKMPAHDAAAAASPRTPIAHLGPGRVQRLLIQLQQRLHIVAAARVVAAWGSVGAGVRGGRSCRQGPQLPPAAPPAPPAAAASGSRDLAGPARAPHLYRLRSASGTFAFASASLVVFRYSLLRP